MIPPIGREGKPLRIGEYGGISRYIAHQSDGGLMFNPGKYGPAFTRMFPSKGDNYIEPPQSPPRIH
jgi:hypothetical protein